MVMTPKRRLRRSVFASLFKLIVVKIPIYGGGDRVIPTLRAGMNVYYETEMNQNDLCE